MKELFELYFLSRNTAIRNQLIEQNMGLARKVAHSSSRGCPYSYENILQIASIGLIKAVERYNPQQGKYFTSFALPYIRGEVLHFLRDKAAMVRIPRNLHETASKVNKASRTLIATHGRNPTNREIADFLSLSILQVDEALAAARTASGVWSLDARLDDSDDLTLGDILVAPSSRGTAVPCPYDSCDLKELISSQGDRITTNVWQLASQMLSAEQQQWFQGWLHSQVDAA